MLELKVVEEGKVVTLTFEHSLLSLSKWESRNKKSFLGTAAKTGVEMIEYFEDMLVKPERAKALVCSLSPEQLEILTNYINDPYTASSIPELELRPGVKETITSELIYYWMVTLRIPFDVEKWHLNRLMMLIRIVNFKSEPPKKQNQMQILAKMRELNEQRKAQYNTKG